MELREYADCDATALAALIRRREVTADEVYATALEAIRLVDAEINAVAAGPWEQPLEYAEDGPFAGVPFVVKDLVIHAAGVPSIMATRLSGDGIVADEDTFAMKQFRAAGFATAALTTAPEFGFGPTTVSLRHGATRNPWDVTRSAGGSTGGTGALVGARAVPVGHANDGGGSIRVPASWNGLVGLKPSRGRVSFGPDMQEDLFGFVVEFALTRTLRDAAAMLDAVAGSLPGDPFLVRRPDRPWIEEVGADPGPLRIALTTDSWSERPTDPEVVATVEAVGRTLEGLGHHVEVASPAFDWERFVTAVTKATVLDVGYGVQEVAAASGLEPGPDTVEHVTLDAYRRRTEVTAIDVMEIKATLNDMSRLVGSFLGGYDVLVTPTINVPAPPVEFMSLNDPKYDTDSWMRELFSYASFTPMFNATGTPALGLPLGMSAAGLPIGVQFAAPMCDEATLLRLGSQLEQALPWADRRPAVDAGR